MLSIAMINGKQNNEPRYAERQIKCVDLHEDNDVCLLLPHIRLTEQNRIVTYK